MAKKKSPERASARKRPKGRAAAPADAHALAADHPLRRARWLWPEGVLYLHNHYAHFRRDFQLDRAPKSARVYVSADKDYKLYVNGRYVCRGPARGYQAHWPFDEVDVASYLKKGHNWIAAEAYNPGIGTYQYVHQAQAGFVCALRAGDVEILTEESSWLMRRSPGHATNTARYSLQLDFQEHVDARAADRAWITSPEPPQGWDPKPVLGGEQNSFPFSRPPWETYEERGIPLLREEIVTPERVTACATGACDEDCRMWENVSWGWIAEEGQIPQWDGPDAVPHRRVDDWLEFDLAPTGQERFRAVTFDVGHMVVGNVILEAEGATGGEIVDVQHYQCLRDGSPRFVPPGRGCIVAMANRLGLAAGRTSHEFFHPMGFRHATVIARDITTPVKLRVKVRSMGYPFEMKGRFTCSDGTLDEIHAACRLTQQVCALDAYVDTPWREQAQWWGDARVQARNTFYLDGDARLLRRGIRSIAGQQTAQGLTYGHAPTTAYHCILPDFSLTWIMTIWDYYWQTGDISLFREQSPRVMQVLSYFDTPDARAPSRLLRHDTRLWYFGDWADLYKGAVPTFINLWYLLTMRTVAEMLRIAKRKGEAAAVKHAAAMHEKLVVKKLFDTEAKLFCDGLDAEGEPVNRHSVHEQTLALMLGLAPKAHENMIELRLLPYLHGRGMDCAVPSAFWCTYTLEEMARRGYGEEVVDFIRRKWTPMLATGTTWEGFEWDETSGTSSSHAWTSHPSFHLVNILAGLTQTTAGWREVRFAPIFPESIDRVAASVPSPLGPIDAKWERTKGGVTAKLKLPAGVKARVELPGARKTVSGKREFAFKIPAKG